MKKNNVYLAVIALAILTFSLMTFNGFAQGGYSEILAYTSSENSQPPTGSFVTDGTFLYAATVDGGTYNKGTIYKIKPDGTGYTKLYDFGAGGTYDAVYPIGTLVLDGNGNLYGMAGGGVNNFATIFKIQTNGNNYSIVYNFQFTNGSYDLSWFQGSLAYDGIGSLYGMSTTGGVYNGGGIFKIGIDGSNYTVLHNFGSIPNDGYEVVRNVITLDGLGNIYGETLYGGTNNGGTIFKMATDGSNYTILHNFRSIPNDGSAPWGDYLLLVGSNLYGMTTYGGTNDSGTVFTINVNGGGYSVLYNFNGANGAKPYGSLFYHGGFLYGMTSSGGAYGYGTAFNINLQGNVLSKLFDFTGKTGSAPGGSPINSFCAVGTNLYGSTYTGGANNDGVMFKINATFLYSMTTKGGVKNEGTIFKIGPGGNNYIKLHDFGSIANDGTYPDASLVYDGTWLYGMTDEGGTSNYGTIFKIKPDGTGYTIVLNFNGTNGLFPLGSFISDGYYLYGMAVEGGTNNEGVIFKISLATNAYTALYNFGNIAQDGIYPYASLVLNGGVLYGMTGDGGANGDGTIFQINTDGTGYAKLLDFTGTAGTAPGSGPTGSLVSDGTLLYGMTGSGGATNDGTVFEFNPSTRVFSEIYNFQGGTDGKNPWASLVYDGGDNLYGMTPAGGQYGHGCIFNLSFHFHSWIYSKMHDFVGYEPSFPMLSDGSTPFGSLYYDGTNIYGMTEYGGNYNMGDAFKMAAGGGTLYKLVSFTGTSGASQGSYPNGNSFISDSTYIIPNGGGRMLSLSYTQWLTINEGQSVTVGHSVYTVSGTYKNLLKSKVNGVDSIVTTYLTVEGESEINAGAADIISLYPDPATTKLHLSFETQDESKSAVITIMDALGRVMVRENTAFSNGQLTTLDIDKLSPGMYFVKVATDKDTQILKFIKE